MYKYTKCWFFRRSRCLRRRLFFISFPLTRLFGLAANAFAGSFSVTRPHCEYIEILNADGRQKTQISSTAFFFSLIRFFVSVCGACCCAMCSSAFLVFCVFSSFPPSSYLSLFSLSFLCIFSLFAFRSFCALNLNDFFCHARQYSIEIVLK